MLEESGRDADDNSEFYDGGQEELIRRRDEKIDFNDCLGGN